LRQSWRGTNRLSTPLHGQSCAEQKKKCPPSKADNEPAPVNAGEYLPLANQILLLIFKISNKPNHKTG
jgi:hypothetical protein